MGRKGQTSFVENFLLSGTAAVISKTGAAPIERIKLLLQSQGEILKAGRMSTPYKGAMDCTLKTYATEGIISFWRGNVANCIRYFPTQALNFSLKNHIKAHLKRKHNRRTSELSQFSNNVAAGGIAGGSTMFFLYSLDYARTRLANDCRLSGNGGNRQFLGLIDVYRKTIKSDGISGMYRGFVAACVAVIIYRGMYFGFYDTLKPLILSDTSNVLHLFLLGYSVTTSAGIVVYPLDTIRRRMMMTTGEPFRYKGSIDCVRTIIKGEGFMSLMKGGGVNVLRGVAGAGVLSGFDYFQNIYTTKRPKS